MKDVFEDCKQIYSHLMDDESKNIFSKRFMYAVTADNKYIKEMVENIYSKDYIYKNGHRRSRIRSVKRLCENT